MCLKGCGTPLLYEQFGQSGQTFKKWHNKWQGCQLRLHHLPGTSSLSLLHDILNWDKLVIRRKKHKALMMFKSLNERAPVYLHDLFHERSTDYDLRNSTHKLALPSAY